jgi:hypothetical protein
MKSNLVSMSLVLAVVGLGGAVVHQRVRRCGG